MSVAVRRYCKKCGTRAWKKATPNLSWHCISLMHPVCLSCQTWEAGSSNFGYKKVPDKVQIE